MSHNFKPDPRVLQFTLDDTVEVTDVAAEAQSRNATQIDAMADAFLDQLLALFDNYVTNSDGTRHRISLSANEMKVVYAFLKDQGMVGPMSKDNPSVRDMSTRMKYRF